MQGFLESWLVVAGLGFTVWFVFAIIVLLDHPSQSEIKAFRRGLAGILLWPLTIVYVVYRIGRTLVLGRK